MRAPQSPTRSLARDLSLAVFVVATASAAAGSSGSSGRVIARALAIDPSVPLAIADETGYTAASGSTTRSRPVDATTES